MQQQQPVMALQGPECEHLPANQPPITREMNSVVDTDNGLVRLGSRCLRDLPEARAQSAMACFRPADLGVPNFVAMLHLTLWHRDRSVPRNASLSVVVSRSNILMASTPFGSSRETVASRNSLDANSAGILPSS
eukprot:scaffold1149_cov380-Prasinococcus_capsulatus_cf.AAC.4